MNSLFKTLLATVMACVSLSVSAGNENGHQWVDMGLPSGTKWATCNIGADSPNDLGDYYTWNGTNLGHLWGGKWRLPTPDEIKELINNCEWTWSNEKRGMRVRSKLNHNEIFFPAAGFMINNSSYSVKTGGHYISSEGSEANGGYVSGLTFNAGSTYLDRYMYLQQFYSVRLVCDDGYVEGSLRRESPSNGQNADLSYWHSNANSNPSYDSENGYDTDSSQSNSTIINRENLPKKTVEGYRVQIFSSNQKTAKAEAYKAAQSAKAAFPEIGVYASYKTPFWKVRVGDFETSAEAQELKDNLKHALPEYAGEIYVVKDKVKVPIY
ncbi:MAG: SPOR domain-containing protein [Paludibacteraceae bacterium]|nr:SPOR domain-containing protein [Paludibacteraceae bacterium]MBP5136285.1 SPOR domain-containing protein [Paludibacteraceae bacterium]